MVGAQKYVYRKQLSSSLVPLKLCPTMPLHRVILRKSSFVVSSSRTYHAQLNLNIMDFRGQSMQTAPGGATQGPKPRFRILSI